MGQGGVQIQFTQLDPKSRVRHGTGNTIATLTDNRDEDGIWLLVSKLHVTASPMHPNPSSVMCIHVGNDASTMMMFQVIGKHFLHITCHNYNTIIVL